MVAIRRVEHPTERLERLVRLPATVSHIVRVTTRPDR